MKVALLMQDENICIFASWGIYDVVGVLMLSSCKPNQQSFFQASGLLTNANEVDEYMLD